MTRGVRQRYTRRRGESRRDELGAAVGTSEGGDPRARDARGEGTHTSASFACASIIERFFRWFLRRREGMEGGARVRRGGGGRGRGNDARRDAGKRRDDKQRRAERTPP